MNLKRVLKKEILLPSPFSLSYLVAHFPGPFFFSSFLFLARKLTRPPASPALAR
jgi:hypothetical protein